MAIKGNNNSKLPEGNNGAREIAYEKWRRNQNARIASKGKKADNVRALASSQAQLAAHHTKSEDGDFSESELPAIAQTGGIVAALTRQEAIDTQQFGQ